MYCHAPGVVVWVMFLQKSHHFALYFIFTEDSYFKVGQSKGEPVQRRQVPVKVFLTVTIYFLTYNHLSNTFPNDKL